MSNGPTDEQIAVIRSAHLMLNSLTTTFSNPSTRDHIGRSAAANFNDLLTRARQAFPAIQGLSSVSDDHTFDPLPGVDCRFVGPDRFAALARGARGAAARFRVTRFLDLVSEGLTLSEISLTEPTLDPADSLWMRLEAESKEKQMADLIAGKLNADRPSVARPILDLSTDVP